MRYQVNANADGGIIRAGYDSTLSAAVLSKN